MTDSPLIASAWLKPDYRSALERSGARIRELTPSDLLPAALDDCDALLLTGGVDVDPALYGAAERHPTVEVDRERDEYEFSLTRLALERDMPLLGRVRESYLRQAQQPDWIRLEGERDKDAVSADVISAVRSRLGLL